MIRNSRPSLKQGLDRDVYEVIRKFESEQGPRLSVSSVYDGIKNSNSSLARLKRRPLEDAIERALSLRRDEIRADEADSDDSDELIEAAQLKEQQKEEERRRRQEARDESLLNRQLARKLGIPRAAMPAAGSDRDSPSAAPRRTKAARRADQVDPASESGMTAVDRLTTGEARPKRRKVVAEDRSPPTNISIKDVAGMDAVVGKLIRLVWQPLRLGPRMATVVGTNRAHNILLRGPSGCGKTMLANAVAATVGVPYIPVNGPSLIGGTSGDSEKNIRAIFDEAIRLAPCIVFLDELECIAGKRETASKQMEARMVAELNHGMDRVARETVHGASVVILAASSSPDSIEPVVRRRFGSEIDVGMPNEQAREQILRAMTRMARLAPDIDFTALAKLTPGFVGSDLRHVVDLAAEETFDLYTETLLLNHLAATAGQEGMPPSQVVATMSNVDKLELLSSVKDSDDDCSSLQISADSFKAAIASVQPAARREGFTTIPDTTWADVGAMRSVREELEMAIIGPITKPALFAKVGIKPAAGILLWGPPGCGKTLVAKAVANESKANFIAVKGPELLSKYVGESERSVRELFSRARASAPCILFFDEMDALAPRRNDTIADSGARVVNALLTELDGVGDRSGVYVIGATNRPDIIDPAIRRPGRLGTNLFVNLPTPQDRVDILETLYRKAAASAGSPDARHRAADTIASGILGVVALDERCNNFSGADLGNLLHAAGKACVRRLQGLTSDDTSSLEPEITMADWEQALDEIKPSVKDLHKYKVLAE